jgi:hypothetical protein
LGKNVWALVLGAITIFYANAGSAQVADRIHEMAYPDPQCAKPDLGLIKPPELGDVTDAAYNARARAYNFHIKAFNQASEAYRACVHAYVDNANREVKRIQDQANIDLKRITDNSNEAIDTVQGKVKRAISDL